MRPPPAAAPITPVSFLTLVRPVQVKYRQEGLRSLPQSLYAQLAETAETQLARTVSELQSQVRALPQVFSVSLDPVAQP